MRPPEPGRPWRVAFVGSERGYGAAAQHAPTAALAPAFVDFREGGDVERMLVQVREHRPHAVVVFAPRHVPTGAFSGVGALTLAWGAGAEGFDRAVGGGWREVPLPVADELFAPLRPMRRPPRVAFVGASSEHRERWLVGVKHRFDVLHVAHEVYGQRLVETNERIDVAICLHRDESGGFEHAVARHLAAGHVVVSEPLDPLFGLEPGIDFLEAAGPRQLEAIIEGLVARDSPARAVRARGRRKAEHFRASRVWPRLVGDLAADVATFGRG